MQLPISATNIELLILHAATIATGSDRNPAYSLHGVAGCRRGILPAVSLCITGFISDVAAYVLGFFVTC
jgi:hypothetical protein